MSDSTKKLTHPEIFLPMEYGGRTFHVRALGLGEQIELESALDDLIEIARNEPNNFREKVRQTLDVFASYVEKVEGYNDPPRKVLNRLGLMDMHGFVHALLQHSQLAEGEAKNLRSSSTGSPSADQTRDGVTTKSAETETLAAALSTEAASLEQSASGNSL